MPDSSALSRLPLVCPLDGQLLRRQGNSLCCPGGHSYDIARQGYINLLPVQFKSTLDPGDSKSMVAARRRVMQAGHFAQLANAVCVCAANLLPSATAESTCVVDAGCGEGYYTAKLAKHLDGTAKASGSSVLGVDISKWSVQAAAAKYPHLAFAVGTNKHLPVSAGSARLIVSLFGFETWQPWSKLQLPGQMVVVVQAGPRHLLELRQYIYSAVRMHEVPAATAALQAGYSLTDESSLTYASPITDSQSLCDILEMTPHGRRANQQLPTQALHNEIQALSIDCVIRTYRRN